MKRFEEYYWEAEDDKEHKHISRWAATMNMLNDQAKAIEQLQEELKQLKKTNKATDIIEKMEELKAKGSKYISLTCKYGEWTFGADHNNGDFSCSKGCEAPEEAVQQVLTKIKL